jgi:formate-dependent phosphoribosylglycinamide formyltransferase (GAR transformylase)
MVKIGTPLSPCATKVVLCGSGELGKEFVIELQRYGVEVIALDKYLYLQHEKIVLSDITFLWHILAEPGSIRVR